MAKPKREKTPPLLKAYNNYAFLNSPAARNIRILTEMLEPAERFRRHQIKNTVVFFGSARTMPESNARRNLKKIELAMRHTRAARLSNELQRATKDVLMSRYYEDAVRIAERLTLWFNTPKNKHKHFVICSGGGPGIMEAANRGARKAKGMSIGLNISLPMEQNPNPYQTKELSFEFHYFFIRKFWFFYLAKALVIFPGGFGTFDELFELLTLIQTEKTKKYMPVVLYGKDYWNKVINFEEMVSWGTISRSDLKLFRIVDTIEEAFEYLTTELSRHYFNIDSPHT
ncbi:MAG: LOG family protein [Candidatus Omnitrophica bacterium]|nr:LOG family protein [Candidatus Omnitrophota bacterium]